jgi:hypothetical protein
MIEKFISLRLFMDSSDEKSFSDAILKNHPHVIFIRASMWETPNPPVFKLINEASNLTGNNLFNEILILDTSITSLESYLNTRIHKRTGTNIYDGASIGPGIMRFNRSRLASYEPGGLMNGSLEADIDPDFGIETQQFIESVFSIFMSGTRRIFVFYPETGAVDKDREENMFFAWPSAIENYDQVDGKYLTHNKWCYFTSKT